MPTYDYECSKCGQTFELFQSMAASPLETCPKDVCAQARWGKGRVRRAIGTGAGLIFKGSGFYITDYRSESYKEAARKEGSAGGTSPTSPSSSGNAPASEAKPAAKDKSAAKEKPAPKAL